MQGKHTEGKEAPQRRPRQEAPASGEQHWGQGAASALARLRVQERAKAEETRALRNPPPR